jgi:hypothetical protein
LIEIVNEEGTDLVVMGAKDGGNMADILWLRDSNK